MYSGSWKGASSCINDAKYSNVTNLQIQDKDGVYGVALVSPPVTTYPAVNPSFRIFTMDPDSLMLTGYQQYHLNITKANGILFVSDSVVHHHNYTIVCVNTTEMYQNGSQEKPQFELSYSTLEEYELSDLSPESWADLVER